MIYPKCNQRHQIMNICLRHDGYVVPCCFLADIGVPWEELKGLLGDRLEQININNNNIDDINKSEAYRIIYKSFKNNPMAICIRECSKKNDPNIKVTASGHPYFQTQI